MAILLDRNSLVVFNKELKVGSIDFQILNQSRLKFFIKKEFASSKKIRFSIVPNVNFLTYPRLLCVEGSKFLNFVLYVNSKSMPFVWEGELIIDEDGFVRKVPIFLRKEELSYVKV